MINRRGFLRGLLGATTAIVAPGLAYAVSSKEGFTYENLQKGVIALHENTKLPSGIYQIDPINSPLVQLCGKAKYGPPIWVTEDLKPYNFQDLIDAKQ